MSWTVLFEVVYSFSTSLGSHPLTSRGRKILIETEIEQALNSECKRAKDLYQSKLHKTQNPIFLD